LGQLVQNNVINTSNYSISIDQLPTGIYMYQIRSGANMQSGKLIKN
jgi:hypothetical protein